MWEILIIVKANRKHFPNLNAQKQNFRNKLASRLDIYYKQQKIKAYVKYLTSPFIFKK